MNTTPLKLSQVKINKANPRTISKDKFQKLVNSLLVFPDMLAIRPVVVDGQLTALGGNMRLNALQAIAKMSPDEVAQRLASTPEYAASAQDEKQRLVEYWGNWLQSPTVAVIDGSTLTESERRQFIIKDNVSFGQWDYDALANDWDTPQLEGWGVDLWNLDGTQPEREAQDDADKGDVGTSVEDDFSDDNEKSVEERCAKGDVWQLGEHRLMCGDSSSKEDFATLMQGEKADLVFTDPPYGVSIGDKNKALNRATSPTRCATNIANDTLPADELYSVLVAAMTNCRENCKEDASYYVTSPQGGELGMMMMMMKDAGLPVRHMLIWEKSSATFSLGRLDYDYQHEPIFYTWGKKHHNYRKGDYRTTIWKYDKPRKCDLHPTMKPVALVANCMNDGTVEGDIVIDAFGGSGTTIIAAEQLGRKARVMELDPHYCSVIISRWERLTGEIATKIEP